MQPTPFWFSTRGEITPLWSYSLEQMDATSTTRADGGKCGTVCCKHPLHIPVWDVGVIVMMLRGDIQDTSNAWVVTTPAVVQLVAGLRLNLSFLSDLSCLDQVREKEAAEYTSILHPTLPKEEVEGWELAVQFTRGTSQFQSLAMRYREWLVEWRGVFRAQDFSPDVDHAKLCRLWAQWMLDRYRECTGGNRS